MSKKISPRSNFILVKKVIDSVETGGIHTPRTRWVVEGTGPRLAKKEPIAVGQEVMFAPMDGFKFSSDGEFALVREDAIMATIE